MGEPALIPSSSSLFYSSSPIINFAAAAGSCFPWKRLDEPAVRSLPGPKQQAAKKSEQLVHSVDHLISKGADRLAIKAACILGERRSKLNANTILEFLSQ